MRGLDPLVLLLLVVAVFTRQSWKEVDPLVVVVVGVSTRK
jgi:hypothetical protein